MRGLFITGTDTGVGKTRVATAIISAALADRVRVGAYKPVCSGSTDGPDGRPVWSDVELLSTALRGRFPSDMICPQRFLAPLAPPLAAVAEGREVNRDQLVRGVEAWRDVVDLLVVEGAGGLLCPLTERSTMADFARELGWPLIVVAANRLGCINHALLTLECARNRGLPVAAVVLNSLTREGDPSQAGNAPALQRYGSGAPLFTLAWEGGVVQSRGGPVTGLDWYRLSSTSQVEL